MSSRLGVALLLLVAAGCTRQDPAPEQANAAAAAPVAGAVDRSHKGEAAPAAQLADVDGKPVSLQLFRGKPLLLNLWATWCAPCVTEMPTLDRAATALGGKAAVVLLNQGEDAAKVRAFLTGKPVRHAWPILDPAMAVSMKLAANLPTTILYDASGKEVWRVTGGRDWASADSLRLIGEAR